MILLLISGNWGIIRSNNLRGGIVLKKPILVLLIILSLGLALNLVTLKSTASADNYIELCPVCDMQGYFTGTSKWDWGHLFWLYKCPSGHDWWVRKN
jgi:hypothetical protein